MIARRVATSIALTLAAAALVFVVGAPPEHCPTIDTEDLEAAAGAAAGWMIDNQLDDGSWLYEYDRATDVAADDYNIIRHAGVTESLYLADTYDIDGALESADRGTEWALDRRVDIDDWTVITDSDRVSAGTNALLLAGLVERRMTTGDDVHDELMTRLGNFLVDQVEPDGAVLAYYDLDPDHTSGQPRLDAYSIYYTGEVYWALTRMHRLDPAGGWGEAADRIGNYIATVRDDTEEIWPPLADHWAGYGLGETAAFPERPTGEPLTDAEVAYTLRQGGMFGQRVRSISQRFGPWGTAVRGTFEPRGGGYGVFGEGLTGLWRASVLDDRLSDATPALADRSICIAALALEAQVDADTADGYASPDKVEGAWFIDDVTRMDDQQHALSGLLLTIPILEAGGMSSTIHTAPAALLWLLVALAVINPLRASFAVPRDRRSRNEIALIAVAGGIAGAGLIIAVGATSGWLLDTLHVSTAAMRVAAGGLCALAGIVDVVRKPPSADPSLPGRRAALVPVAIPLVARPAIIIAGISLVADHGLSLLTLSVAIAVAALALVAPFVPDDGPMRLVLMWGVRLLAAVAVVGGVLLSADGVLDI